MMPRIRMVHIAAGSLSLIVDICQSNKERLEKQFDRQTCFYNAINSQTCLIHLRIWVIVVFFKKLLIDGKSQGRCSSYHNPLPFAHLTRWQWKIGQLNLRWHFHEKPAQLPLQPWLWCSSPPSSSSAASRFTWSQCHHLCHHNVAPGAVVADAMLDNVARLEHCKHNPTMPPPLSPV